jgi:hypothetical protein
MHERATASGNGHPTEFDPLPDARALTLANAFLRFSGHSARAEGGDRKPLTLWSWRQEFFSWDGSVYQKLLPERFASDVSRFLDLQRVAKKVRGGLDTEAVDATPKLVAEIVRKIALLCQANVRQMPAWLDDHRPPAENVIAFRNGWIDVAEYLMDRQGIQNPPTAHWFSEHVIPTNTIRHPATIAHAGSRSLMKCSNRKNPKKLPSASRCSNSGSAIA